MNPPKVNKKNDGIQFIIEKIKINPYKSITYI